MPAPAKQSAVSAEPADKREVAAPSPRPGFAVVRRVCACGGRDDESTVRRSARSGGHEFGNVGVKSAPGVPAHLARYMSASAGSGAPLDAALRTDFEASFGRSLAGVRVVSDAAAAHATDALNARAMTIGNTIWFGRGEYRPESPAGQRLIAHEVAHTLQQQGAGTSLQKELVVGEVNDPAEAAADRAADAVLRREPVRLAGGSGAILRRQSRTGGGQASSQPQSQPTCSVSPMTGPGAAQDNVWRADCGAAGSWRVTVTTTDVPARPLTIASARPGMNAQDVYLDIRVCRGGAEVQIRPSVDLPRALLALLPSILQGSSALQNTTVTPSLFIVITASQTVRITLGGFVTVQQQGATQAGGQLCAQIQRLGNVNLCIQGSVNPQNTSQWQLGGSVQGTFGSVPQVRCETKPRQYVTLRCESITHIDAVPPVPDVPAHEAPPEYAYVLFNYKEATFSPDPLHQNPAGQNPPLDRVRALVSQGYHVRSIRGYTSPEGPLATGPNFPGGNQQLGRDRARAVETWLRSADGCPQCFDDQAPDVGADTDPQLYQAHDPRGREIEQAPLAQSAQRDFVQSPDELAPPDANVPGRTAAQQTEYVYRALRRVRITFGKTIPLQPGSRGSDARDEFGGMSVCPDFVEARVRERLGVR